MPKRFRLNRRLPVAMTEDGFRRLKRFAADARLDQGEALSFLFKHFDSVIDTQAGPGVDRGSFSSGGHRLPSLYRTDKGAALWLRKSYSSWREHPTGVRGV